MILRLVASESMGQGLQDLTQRVLRIGWFGCHVHEPRALWTGQASILSCRAAIKYLAMRELDDYMVL